MVVNTIKGSCLCGQVQFECSDQFELFHFCHCTQCQKMTGSAHASNLFTQPDNLNWTAGEKLVQRYDVSGRSITNAFCQCCGSRMPYLSKTGQLMVVPAGVLDENASIAPVRNLFWSERASWYEAGFHSKKVAAMDVDD